MAKKMCFFKYQNSTDVWSSISKCGISSTASSISFICLKKVIKNYVRTFIILIEMKYSSIFFFCISTFIFQQQCWCSAQPRIAQFISKLNSRFFFSENLYNFKSAFKAAIKKALSHSSSLAVWLKKWKKNRQNFLVGTVLRCVKIEETIFARGGL